MIDAEKARYAYKANIMNDVHMSHAMEFPYPQSMSNCATCHEGKLDMILTDANFANPVEAMRYDLHVEHVYPNFTIKNCESCHNEGMFDVPDQSKSLPGLLSRSDSLTGWDRNIGTMPAYITGPASRACGSCHRSHLINEDEAGKLVSFNQHTKQGGYLIKEGADSGETQGLLMTAIDYIMGLFK